MSRVKSANPKNYGELLKDGLSSLRSYVVLKQKNRSPVYLCFKPVISRLNSHILYVGGKLAIFPDKTHEQWAEAASRSDIIQMLKNAWVELPPDRVSAERIGSHAGVYMIATPADKDLLLQKFDASLVIETLMGSIEVALSVQITQREEVKEFLAGSYATFLQQQFYEGYQGSGLPERQVGKIGPCLLGQSYIYELDNYALIAFMESYHITPAHESNKPYAEDYGEDDGEDKAQDE